MKERLARAWSALTRRYDGGDVFLIGGLAALWWGLREAAPPGWNWAVVGAVLVAVAVLSAVLAAFFRTRKG